MSERITPQELKDRLEKGPAIQILDVREADEFAVANLGGLLLPLHELPSRLDEIPRDKDTVVLCHHGVRSAHAVAFLRQSGFEKVMNLSGGIDRWAIEIDPAMRRY
jgi:rhodanese-related sulfurtransferase